MLAYTLNKLLGNHKIVVERDETVADAFGAEGQRTWVEIGTHPGLFSWWPSHGEGAFDEHADPQRNVQTSGGSVLLRLGIDVTENDRVARIIYKDGTEVEGPFRITSRREHPQHIELSVERP